MLPNCDAGEDSSESLDSKEVKPVIPKGNQPQMFTGRTDVETEAQNFGHLMGRDGSSERPWCWERLSAGGEESDRGWDGWMASPAQGTWVWTNSGRQWRSGKPGKLQFMGSQSVGHDLADEQQQIKYIWQSSSWHLVPNGNDIFQYISIQTVLMISETFL